MAVPSSPERGNVCLLERRGHGGLGQTRAEGESLGGEPESWSGAGSADQPPGPWMPALLPRAPPSHPSAPPQGLPQLWGDSSLFQREAWCVLSSECLCTSPFQVPSLSCLCPRRPCLSVCLAGAGTSALSSWGESGPRTPPRPARLCREGFESSPSAECCHGEQRPLCCGRLLAGTG